MALTALKAHMWHGRCMLTHRLKVCSAVLHANLYARLPTRVCVCVYVCMYACVSQGLWDTQIESLRGLELQVKEIVIEPYSHVLNLPPHQHISTLRNTLRQVGDAVKASGGTTLCLKGWPWTEDLIREYIGAIPALKECGIAGQALHLVGALTDDLLGAVLQVGVGKSLACVMHVFMGALSDDLLGTILEVGVVMQYEPSCCTP